MTKKKKQTKDVDSIHECEFDEILGVESNE